MHEPTAQAANSNLRRVAEHGFGGSLLESRIQVGDGTIGDTNQRFAMLISTQPALAIRELTA